MAPTEVYKVDAHIDGTSLWAGTVDYNDIVGKTYADAYAKAMAMRVRVHSIQRWHWYRTHILAYRVLWRLLVVAQHAITADQLELQRELRKLRVQRQEKRSYEERLLAAAASSPHDLEPALDGRGLRCRACMDTRAGGSALGWLTTGACPGAPTCTPYGEVKTAVVVANRLVHPTHDLHQLHHTL